MKKTMNEQAIIEKVKKLLALAGNNSSEHEANAAYAKAQALIAEYSLELSEEQGEEVKVVMKECTHSNNEGYRKPLAVIIADNFRVKAFVRAGTVVFFGLEQDVEIAVEVYNHAYRYSHNRGLRLEREARANGYSTKGVANSYWLGFMKGLKAVLDEQCKALMIITPEAVEQKWAEEMAPTLRKGSGGQRATGFDAEAYNAGEKEGREHMRQTKSLEG